MTSNNVAVSAGPAARLVITGSGTLTAGGSQNITITAQDAGGNTSTTYTGDKNLIFSGANLSSSPATSPTVSNKIGTAINFGSATTITFTNGVATVSGSNNGVMKLYKAETAAVSVSDGSISSSGSYNLSVTVSAAAANKLEISTQPAGGASGGVLSTQPVVQVKDVYGNLVASTASVSAAIKTGAGGTLGGTTSVTASGGTATFTNLTLSGLVGTNYTLEFTSSGLTSITSSSVNVSAGLISRLVITGNGTQIAGGSQNITITAKDASGNTVTSYAGDKNLTFSGANASLNPLTNPTVSDKSGTAISFGSPGTFTFVSGVAAVSGSNNGVMKLYKAETAIVSVTDGSITSANDDRLTVTVGFGAFNKLSVSLTSPQINAVDFTGTNTLTALDFYGNTVTNFYAPDNNIVVTTSLTGSVISLNGTNTIKSPDSFVNGVSDRTARGMKYTGLTGTGTFTFTPQNGGNAVTSANVTINPGTATKLIITGSSSQISGASQNITITAKDISGNTATSYTGDKTLIFSGASSIGDYQPAVKDKNGNWVAFTASTTLTFNNGVASVVSGNNGVMNLYKAETATIAVTDGTISTEGSDRLTVTVSAGAAAKLAINTQPVGGSSGNVLSTQPVIGVLDTQGNPVSSTASITVAIKSGLGGTLGGTNTVSASAGIATFTDLSLTGLVETNYTLEFTATGLTAVTSANVLVTAGAISRLVLTGSSSQTAGIGQSLTITARDAAGNRVSSYTGDKNLTFSGAGTSPDPVTTATVTDKSGTPVNFGSAAVITFTSGVATVTAGNNGVMKLYKAESATISVSDGTYSTSGSDRLSVTVNASSVTKLGIATQPIGGSSGALLTTQPVIELRDAYGNIVSGTSSVTVAIKTGAGGTLGGTTTVVAVAGTATFTNLTLAGTIATNYTLEFTSSGLTAVTSSNLTVTPGLASKLVITGNTSQTAGSGLSLTITAKDAQGNTATGYTGDKSITFSGANSSSSPVTAPTVSDKNGTAVNFGTATTITFSSGVASVSGSNNGVMKLYKVESATIAATDGGISAANSDRLSVTVSVASPAQLAINTQPVGAASGTVLSTQPVIAILDAYGNQTSGTNTINAAVNSDATGTLGGTTSIAAVSGVATYTDLTLAGIVGTNYTFIFTSTGLSSVISSNINVSSGTATKLVITGSGTQTAGSVQNLTVTAKDPKGNTATTYTGDKNLVFSGANSSTFPVEAPSVTNKSGAVVNFGNNTVISFTNGIASVTSGNNGALTLYKAETASVAVSDGNISSSGTDNLSVIVSAGSVSKLNFGQQPANTVSATVISPAITVRIEDAYGNLISGDTRNVTLAIGTNPSSGVLSGTTTVAASAGIATFNNLSINKSGIAYTLTATSNPVLVSATSSSFNITAATATSLSIVSLSPSYPTKGLSNAILQVGIVDANGNLVAATADTEFSLSLTINSVDATSSLIRTDETGIDLGITPIRATIPAGQSSVDVDHLKFTQSTGTDGLGAVNVNAVITATRTSGMNLTSVAGSAFGIVEGNFYRPKASGNWTAVSWEKSIDGGTSWSDVATPTATSLTATDIVSIPAAITTSLNTDITLYNLLVPGVFDIVSNTLTLAHSVQEPSSYEITVHGTFRNSGGTFVNNDAAQSPIKFTGGIYEHTRNGGEIPIAKWEVHNGTNSKVKITGITSTALTAGLNQIFNDLEWNNAAQAVAQTLHGNTTITGVLTLSNGQLSVGSNTLTLNGQTIAGTPSNLVTTSSSNLYFGGSSAGINLPSSVTQLNNLTINNSNGLSLNSNPQINGVLALTSGIITTGSNSIAIASGASVSHTSGHVSGNLKMYLGTGNLAPATFHIGTATDYTPLLLNIDGEGGTGGYLTASTAGSAHSQITSSDILTDKDINRYWTLTPDGTIDLGTRTFSAKMTFLSGDVGAANTNNFVIRRYSGGTWSAPVDGEYTRNPTDIQYSLLTLTSATEYVIGEANSASKLVITGSGTQVAGAGQDLTITARDSNGNIALSYSGVKNITFSGANSSVNPVTAPSVKDKDGNVVSFATATPVRFTNGIATVSSGNNGRMSLYKAELATISASDGSITASGSDRLSVTVSAASYNKLAVSLTSPQLNDIAFTGTNTVTAQDAYGNTITGFDASANNVTVTSGLGGAITGLSGTDVLNNASDFNNGVADLTNTLTYTGTTGTGTFTFTPASGSAVTSSAITVNPGAATKLVITGSSTQIAGNSQVLTLTAKDVSGNTVTSYTGDKSLIFSGSSSSTNPVTQPTVSDKNGNAVNFGTATLITFSNGVATVSGNNNGVIRLYKSGSAVISATDGSISATGTDRLSVNVSTANFNKFVVSLSSPQASGIVFTGTNTLTAQDMYGNTVTSYDASMNVVSVSTSLSGSISGLSGTNVMNSSGDFSSGVANLNSRGLIYSGSAGTGTFTFTPASGNAATSSNVTFSSGLAIRLAITGSANQNAGTGQNLTIKALDEGGNTVPSYTGDKTLTFSGANSSVSPVTVPTVTDKTGLAIDFGNITTITFNSGVATVSSGNNGLMTLYKAEEINISVSDGSISSEGTDRLTVIAAGGTASKMRFAEQPLNTTAGTTISPSLTVRIEDNYGNLVAGDTRNVTLAIGNNPAAGTLSGTVTRAASGGIATFNDLSINKAGTAYTLTASSSPVLTTATTNNFNISASVGTSLSIISLSPQSPISGLNSTVLRVGIVDAYGNTVTASSDTEFRLSLSIGGLDKTSTLKRTDAGGVDLGISPIKGTISSGQTYVELNYLKFLEYSAKATDTEITNTAVMTVTRTNGMVLSAAASSAFAIIEGHLYRPKTSGNWTDVAWEQSIDNGLTWSNVATPATTSLSEADIVQIPAAITTSLNTAITLYNMIIDGVFDISSGTLTLNHTADDHSDYNIHVHGTLKNSGGTFVNSNALYTPGVFHGGTYEHARNGGELIQGAWQSRTVSSITSYAKAKVTGITSTALSSGLNQTFMDFEWSNASQTVSQTLHGNTTISRDLTLNGGQIAIGSNTLTLNGSAIAGTSSNLIATSASSISFGGSSSGLFIPSGISALNNLQLNNSNGLSINSALTVNGVLTLNSGNINNGLNTLTIASAGSVSRNSGHIVGKLSKNLGTGNLAAATYEIGTATDYTPLIIDIDGIGGTAGNLILSTTGSAHPQILSGDLISDKDINRYWTLTSDGTFALGSRSYKLRLNYVSGDVGSANTANFVIRTYNNGWSAPDGGVYTRTGTYTEYSRFTTLSDFATGEASAATRLVISGTASQTAGTSQNLTITAKDSNGNTAYSYTGNKSLTFSGAGSTTNPVFVPKLIDKNGAAVNFGTSTTILFTNGLAAVSGGQNGVATLYKAETASITASDGTITSSDADRHNVTVSTGSFSKLDVSLASPQPSGAGFIGTNTLTAQDAYGNTVTNFDASANNITVSTNLTGAISGLSGVTKLNNAADFSNGIANLTNTLIFTGTPGIGTFTFTPASGVAITSGNVEISNSIPQTTPTFSPAAGAVAFGTELTIISDGASAIYYTIDGSNPATSAGGSTFLYNPASKPLINSAQTIKAIAVRTGFSNSATGSASYSQAASADLNSIVLSGSPSGFTFASGTYSYTGVSVGNSVNSITITPTGIGTITVDGSAVSSGTASAAISLNADVAKSISVVLTETGKSSKVYTITVTRMSIPVMSGSVSISGTPRYGETLSAAPSLTNSGTPVYQWYRGANPISGAVSSNYTLVEADIAFVITVTATADGVSGTGSVTSSGTTAVQKATAPAAPAAPVLLSKTTNSIALVANALHEFSKNGTTWQSSNVFSGLSVSTQYTFYARVMETGTTNASAASAGVNINTSAGSKYIVTSGNSSPIAGSAVTVSAQLADADNSPVGTAGLTVIWTKSDANGSFASATSQTNASGIATVVFTTHTAAQTSATVTATDNNSLSGTSASITTVAGPVLARNSILSPLTASISANGTSTQILTVRAKDLNSNDLNVGGQSVAITKLSGTGTISGTTDKGDGTYFATVTAPAGEGEGIFVAAINGQAVENNTGSQAQARITYLSGISSDLSNIVISGSPSGFTFNPAIYTYNNVSVANSVASITVSPSGSGVITVNGFTLASGTASAPISIAAGTETTITVGTTESGKFSKTYTIKLSRIADTQVSPVFSPAAGAVVFGTELTITSAGADAIYYTIDGTNPNTSAGGSTFLYSAAAKPKINAAGQIKAIAVKAGLLNSAIASVNYTQEPAADLSNIILSNTPYNYVFSSGIYAFCGVAYNNQISGIRVKPIGTGTITVDGKAVTSNSESDIIPLIAGTEKEIQVITSSPGRSDKVYKINVIRAMPDQVIPDVITGITTVTGAQPKILATSPTDDIIMSVSEGTGSPTIDFNSLITGGLGILPKTTIYSSSSDIYIPEFVNVKAADTSWNGVLIAPTIKTLALDPVNSEIGRQPVVAIELGSSGVELSFDQAVRIVMKGQTGKKVGFIVPGGQFTEISVTGTDSQAAANAMPEKGAYKVDNGTDIIIWTKHFTTFISYVEVSRNTAIRSAVYNVSGTLISNIPYGTSKSDLLANLTKAESNQTWNTDNISASPETGNYLTVTAQDGITKTVYSITVNERNDAPADISLTGVNLFENQSAGTIAGTLTSTPKYSTSNSFTYSLVEGKGGTDNNLFTIAGNKLVTAAILNYEGKTSYSVLVRSTSVNGFSYEKIFTINLADVNEAPTLNALANRSVCFSTEIQKIALSGISAGPESAQNLSLAVGADNSSFFEELTVNDNTINYKTRLGMIGIVKITVTVSDDGGTEHGGVNTISRTFELTINPSPVVDIISDKGLVISKGEKVQLNAAGGITYKWQDAHGIVSGQNSGILTVRPAVTTTYTVNAGNASGCITSAGITITVLNDYKAIKPTNIITPNNDGKNDKWIIENIDMYPNHTVKIFDKAGRVFYTSRNYQNDWDGTYQGSPLIEDTYYYIIDFGADARPIKGFITIIY
ncbi:gliding motility-associated C-terminal domain-containing protein [Daejeonella sp. H1SJ63]|uniref:T9SS type B sorting domain-containing protein n=1 Tax=Daejeonella sp. H1SJ63 TaxID=3034145 RepID=UPI0023EB3ADC|nr:gliding motility-associated C-terminal domain-containing protein [Daejeonella sp. H1SJ63]